MNIIALCQGQNLNVFSELYKLAGADLNLEKLGLFVADAAYFKSNQFLVKNFPSDNTFFLKEWEENRIGLKTDASRKKLEYYQSLYGKKSLNYSLLVDRRLYFGKFCKYTQSYKSRFTDEQLNGILLHALDKVEDFFDKVKPDLIFAFVPVTLYEFLIIKKAKQNNVDVRILRSTKVKNYISLNDRLIGLSSHFGSKRVNNPNAISVNIENEINEYIIDVQARGSFYEGMHHTNYSERKFNLINATVLSLKSIFHEIKKMLDYDIKTDTHNPGYFIPVIYQEFIQPLKAFKARSLIAKKITKECMREVLEGTNFAFYPLHFEPEIALQIYGVPFQNQIELIRNISLSLPAGMKLVVKDHPRSAGLRKLSYYKKIQSIPNVILWPTEGQSHALVKMSKMVFVVSGNVAMEAAINKKPVVVFGQPEYAEELYPLVTKCHHVEKLSVLVSKILDEYEYNEVLLKDYLFKIIQGSVKVDLYSKLLNKKNRLSYSKTDLELQMSKLRTYLLARLKDKEHSHGIPK